MPFPSDTVLCREHITGSGAAIQFGKAAYLLKVFSTVYLRSRIRIRSWRIAAAHSRKSTWRLALKRILVLEDEELFSMLLKDVFVESGYQVEVAEDGRAALEKGQDFRPDIFFTDWRFSGSATSVQVADGLRTSNPKLKVILLTGVVGEEAARAAKALDAFCLLIKPSSIDDILGAAQAAASALDSNA
jgi:CheY-like chemotaxis protein